MGHPAIGGLRFGQGGFVSYQPSTGVADPQGHETGFVADQAEQQVPPLRFAPVGMTIPLENWRYRAK
jgi:hypothetical protein